MTTTSLRSGNASDDYQDESGILDTVDDQLADAFDGLTAKSAKTRLAAFELIRRNFTQRYMIEFVFSRKLTLLDSIARCIRRSKGQDLSCAANLMSTLCVTIGSDPELDPVFAELVSLLLINLEDQTINCDVRRQCARSIAICCYIIGMEGYVEQVMDRLYLIFTASCAKGDGKMPTHAEDVCMLHSTCLQSWAMLLSALHQSSPQVAIEAIEENMDKVTELLDSPHLDLRISAGETLVMMFEMIKAHNKDVTADDFSELCEKIQELSTETQKSRGKKDMRLQRSNFREILAAIEEENPPSVVIKFGREKLILEDWSKRRQYDAFCELLGTGLNQHLAENEILRDVFGLGPPLMDMDLPRVKRSDNYYENMVADKQRTKNMRKLRDKRAVVVN